jgi:hypothetical protein
VADHLETDTGNLSRFETGSQGMTLVRFEKLLALFQIDLCSMLIVASENGASQTLMDIEAIPVAEATLTACKQTWQQLNPVLASCSFAGREMLLVQTSFENQNFELHYSGYRLGDLKNTEEAKANAKEFAAAVLCKIAKTCAAMTD